MRSPIQHFTFHLLLIIIGAGLILSGCMTPVRMAGSAVKSVVNTTTTVATKTATATKSAVGDSLTWAGKRWRGVGYAPEIPPPRDEP